jgi:DNA replication and repair protein RecF
MVRKLRVQNFRKHADLSVDFKSGMTVITGANGSGKTSLLEAIYISLQGKSWRSNFTEILRDSTTPSLQGVESDVAIHTAKNNWWRIDIEFPDDEKRTVKFNSSARHCEVEGRGNPCDRSFEIGGQKFARLPAKFKKPVILFEPNDLQLLYGSPTRRRDFFDRFISQIEPSYSNSLRKFERILRQRNNLLKRGTTRDELFIWDLQFADLAEKIIAIRDKWVKEINNNLTKEYQKISSTNDQITIKYVAPQKSRQQILNQLTQDFAENWPYTKVGPQTHDIKFKINNHDAKMTASRGENRTIIFASLAAMTKILNQTLGEKVYLLFDDIDSELDSGRRNKLYKSQIFADNYLFATTIKANDKTVNVVNLED